MLTSTDIALAHHGDPASCPSNLDDALAAAESAVDAASDAVWAAIEAIDDVRYCEGDPSTVEAAAAANSLAAVLKALCRDAM